MASLFKKLIFAFVCVPFPLYIVKALFIAFDTSVTDFRVHGLGLHLKQAIFLAFILAYFCYSLFLSSHVRCESSRGLSFSALTISFELA